jgi:hypothetical protein
MHSTIKVPGTDMVLAPVPQVTLSAGRMWHLKDADGNHLGVVQRVRENPGTIRERTRWGATTPAGVVYYPLPSRGQAITQLTTERDAR